MIYTKQNIIYINTNYNKDYIILGLNDGYEIYKIEPFKLLKKNKLNKSIGIINILENTNIIIFTGSGNDNSYCNKNKLILYDDNIKKEISKITLDTNILNLKITPKYILCVLIDKTIIYDHNLSIINYINTINNNHGIISIYYNKFMLKYSLLGENKGDIIIGTDNIFSKKIIKAHNNNINNICFNHDGKILATNSILGTIIRIFNTDNYNLIKELRRGSTITRLLYMDFNIIADKIICSSIKGTIHLFNTGINFDMNIKNKKIKYLSDLFSILPKNKLSSYINSEWSYINYKNNDVLFLLLIIKNNKIYSVSNDGKLYILEIDNNNNIKIINILFFTDNYIKN